MISLSAPEDGDVVVRIVHIAARASYVLCVVPGEGQVAYADRQEATARAVAYAERTGVNAWYADPEDRLDGNFFALP
jgi:hypothetical protein